MNETKPAEWFQGVFECMNDAVFVHDIITGAIMEVNQRALEMYEGTLEAIKSMSVARLSANVPPYTQQDALTWMRKTVEEGPQLFEWQARTLTGQVFWVEVNMRKAGVAGREIVVAAVRDISKRKQVENDLRRSEERFRSVLGNSKDPVYCLNLPGLTYDYMSPAVEQVLGFTVEECLKGGVRFMRDRIHPEDRDRGWGQLENLALNGGGNGAGHEPAFQPQQEYRFQHKDQGYRWISDNRSLVRDRDGRSVIIGNLKDVTRRREQENALQEKHAALLFHLENTSLALVECDMQGRMVAWSPQAEKVFGWQAAEVIGRHYTEWEFIHPDDLPRVKATVGRLMDHTESRNSCINRNFRKDGRVIVCEWHNSVLHNEHGEIQSMLSLASDITLEKKLEEALRAMAEGVDPRSGETFFQSLCLHLAHTLEARYASVAMFLPERDRMARTLGFCADGQVQPNLTYSLVGTPCYNVLNDEVCYYDCNVRQHFPNDRFLADKGVESYMGMPLHASDGRIIGLITVFSDKPLDHQERLQAMFHVFAVRAAAEMERHHAEMALRRSEERYSLAASGSTAGIWDWDIRTGGVYYSSRFRELLGYTSDEFPNLFFAWEQKMHPQDLPLVRTALERHLEMGEVFCVQHRILVKGGSYRWFEARGQALWDTMGEPYRMAGSALDIHERKLDEQRLLRLNRLHAMSSSINEAIVRIQEPQELYEAAVRIAVEKGSMKMAWIGLYVEETATLRPVAWAGANDGYLDGIVLVLRKDHPAGLGPTGRAFRSGEPAISNEIASDDSFYYRERALAQGFRSCAAFPLKPGGKSLGMLMIYADEAGCFQEEEIRVLSTLANDLSFAMESTEKENERQRAIEALRENERMISTLMGNLPGAAYRSLIDEKWTLEFISEGCLELTGYEAEAFADKGEMFFGDLIHPDDRDHRRSSIEDAVAAGKRFEVTYRIRTADGAVKWIWERGQGVPAEDGVVHIEGFKTDVTEKRRMESQFLRNQRLESIGTLAGGVAHDLNNVLTPILMSLAILRMKLTHPRDVELLNSLESSANRGADMVKQILSFARGVENRSTLLRAKDVLHEIEHLILETFPKSLRLVVNRAEDVWGLEGDPTQLHQVLLNLCVNARDAMPEGGELTLSVSNVTIDGQFASMHPDATPGPHVVFEVRDSGVGIPADLRDRIFDPFFTTKEVGKGTGLGLSTTLGIVRSHRGFIDVTSQMRKGTAFRVYLPAKTTMEEIREAPPVRHQQRMGAGELLLVVDDESAILTTTRQTLEAFGYRVITACDGTDAIATFLKGAEKPALVITDMMMPNMDGPAMIQALQKIQPGMPFIGASGLNHQMQAQVTSLGVKHFLRKPYTADALLEAIGDLLAPESPQLSLKI